MEERTIDWKQEIIIIMEEKVVNWNQEAIIMKERAFNRDQKIIVVMKENVINCNQEILVGIIQAPKGFIPQYFIEKLSLVPLHLILER